MTEAEKMSFIIACQNDWQGQNDGINHYCEVFGDFANPFKETPKTYSLTFRGIKFTLEKFHRKSRILLTDWDRYPPQGGRFFFQLVFTAKDLWRECSRIIKYLTKQRTRLLSESRQQEQEINKLRTILIENGIPISSEWEPIRGGKMNG